MKHLKSIESLKSFKVKKESMSSILGGVDGWVSTSSQSEETKGGVLYKVTTTDSFNDRNSDGKMNDNEEQSICQTYIAKTK